MSREITMQNGRPAERCPECGEAIERHPHGHDCDQEADRDGSTEGEAESQGG